MSRTTLADCPASPFGHILVITYRRTWKFFRRTYLVRCFDCDYVCDAGSEESARALVKLYHPDIIDEDFG